MPFLDYASSNAPTGPQGPGIGYYILIFVNSIALITGTCLFLFEVSGDAYAPMAGMLAGLPLLLGEVLLGGLPAWIYLVRSNITMTKLARGTLILLSFLPSVLGVTGIILSFALPRTHGSGC